MATLPAETYIRDFEQFVLNDLNSAHIYPIPMRSEPSRSYGTKPHYPSDYTIFYNGADSGLGGAVSLAIQCNRSRRKVTIGGLPDWEKNIVGDPPVDPEEIIKRVVIMLFADLFTAQSERTVQQLLTPEICAQAYDDAFTIDSQAVEPSTSQTGSQVIEQFYPDNEFSTAPDVTGINPEAKTAQQSGPNRHQGEGPKQRTSEEESRGTKAVRFTSDTKEQNHID